MLTGSLEGFKKWILMSENERRMMEKEYLNQENGYGK